MVVVRTRSSFATFNDFTSTTDNVVVRPPRCHVTWQHQRQQLDRTRCQQQQQHQQQRWWATGQAAASQSLLALNSSAHAKAVFSPLRCCAHRRQLQAPSAEVSGNTPTPNILWYRDAILTHLMSGS